MQSDEIHIDARLVRRLLREQHEDLATLELRPCGSGLDNAMFRLGERLAVRLPKRVAAAPFLLVERAWLPVIANRLATSTPIPVREGLPSRAYPWHWSIVKWVSGVPADHSPLGAEGVMDLVTALRSLHLEAPAPAPRNPFRGVPLSHRQHVVVARLRRLEIRTSCITPAIWRVWERALDAEPDVAPVWIHGDLHPHNILVERGRLAGIIDWSDMAAGDRATDLAVVWMLLSDQRAREEAMAAYPTTDADAVWARARGWAVLFGALLLESGLRGQPRYAEVGARTLERVMSP